MWCFSFAFIFKEDHSCSGYSPTLSVAVDALPGEEGETNQKKWFTFLNLFNKLQYDTHWEGKKAFKKIK